MDKWKEDRMLDARARRRLIRLREIDVYGRPVQWVKKHEMKAGAVVITDENRHELRKALSEIRHNHGRESSYHPNQIVRLFRPYWKKWASAKSLVPNTAGVA